MQLAAAIALGQHVDQKNGPMRQCQWLQRYGEMAAKRKCVYGTAVLNGPFCGVARIGFGAPARILITQNTDAGHRLPAALGKQFYRAGVLHIGKILAKMWRATSIYLLKICRYVGTCPIHCLRCATRPTRHSGCGTRSHPGWHCLRLTPTDGVHRCAALKQGAGTPLPGTFARNGNSCYRSPMDWLKVLVMGLVR